MLSEKKLYKLPDLGGGRGKVIPAMPERMHSFPQETVPYIGQCKVKLVGGKEKMVVLTFPLSKYDCVTLGLYLVD